MNYKANHTDFQAMGGFRTGYGESNQTSTGRTIPSLV
jgi:hypothetical protein